MRVLRDEIDLQPFSWDTIKRAAKALGLRGEGEKKSRVWMLPNQAKATVMTMDFGAPRKAEVETPAPACLEEVPVVEG